MIDPNDIKIECLQKIRSGQQIVDNQEDSLVTHLPSGISVFVPHTFHHSQHKRVTIALEMLEWGLVNK